MSSLQSTFAIKAFRESLSGAISYAQSDADSLHKALRTDAKAPRGLDATTWLNRVGAVRLAYLTALREDRAAVYDDIRTVMSGDFSAAELDQFLKLLGQDDAIDARSAVVLGTAAKQSTEISRDEDFRVNGATSPTTSTVWTLGNG